MHIRSNFEHVDYSCNLFQDLFFQDHSKYVNYFGYKSDNEINETNRG